MTTQQRLYKCLRANDPALALWRYKMLVDNQYERRKSKLYLEFFMFS